MGLVQYAGACRDSSGSLRILFLCLWQAAVHLDRAAELGECLHRLEVRHTYLGNTQSSRIVYSSVKLML